MGNVAPYVLERTNMEQDVDDKLMPPAGSAIFSDFPKLALLSTSKTLHIL